MSRLSQSPRPEPGQVGRVVKVYTNHFPVITLPNTVFVHYDVVIQPSNLPSRRNLQIIDHLQTNLHPEIFRPRAVYDGKASLFSVGPLMSNGQPIQTREFTFSMKGYQGDGPSVPSSSQSGGSRATPQVKVILKDAARIDPKALQIFLEGRSPVSNAALQATTLLNMLVRMVPIMKFTSNSRSFFTPEGSKKIAGGFELWRGYFQSVRPTLGRMLVNIDISTATMYQSGNLLDLTLAFISSISNDRVNARDLRRMDQRTFARLQTFLKGLRVYPTHRGKRGENARPIRALDMRGASVYSFALDNGEDITISTYLERTYGLRLKYPDLPCVKIGQKVVLPLELCEVVPGQLYKRRLPPDRVSDVLQFSTKRPGDRLDAIVKGLRVIDYASSSYMRDAGMTVDPQPMLIDGRVINPPELQFNTQDRPIVPSEGKWNILRKSFHQPASIGAWAVVNFGNHIADTRHVQHFVSEMVNVCRALNITVENPQPPIVPLNGMGDVLKDLDNVVAKVKAMQQDPRKSMFLLVILPMPAPDIRRKVKYFSDVERGVPTQCVTAQNVRDKRGNQLNQYLNNVALKLNVKLGGVNSVPVNRSIAWIDSAPTMIVGCDVSHPSPGQEGVPSITALVSSVDHVATRYVASSNVQTGRNEIVEDLKDMMINALRKFNEYQNVMFRRNIWPHQILFYRDGVGEGQYDAVSKQEITAINAAMLAVRNAVGDSFKIKPKLTFVIVGKRHHVRFIPRQGEGDAKGNCPPGLVVDSGVTNPWDWDFYLQSHAGLLGTSRPSHYTVLHDENGLSPDQIQSISYALCHVHARTTRAVSAPAPVMYADIVCTRARYHFVTDVHLGDDSTTDTGSQMGMDEYRNAYRPLHRDAERRMYFI